MKSRKQRTRRRLIVESLEGRRLLAASAPNPFDLATLDGSNGFRIDGQEHDDQASDVTGAGDVNGDGLDDFVISSNDETYVVFGSSNAQPAEWNLNEIDGSNGFTIRSSDPSAGRPSFAQVDGAGDVNGDGFDDLVLSQFWYGDREGMVYIIYGRSEFPASFDVIDINGANGYRIAGDIANDSFGLSIAGVGDVNGDGFDDIAADYGHNRREGEDYRAYVVYGRAESPATTISRSEIQGQYGFVINGASNLITRGIATGGDVNGDGYDDIVLAHQTAVIFGAATVPGGSVQIDELDGTTGFRISTGESDSARTFGSDLGGDFNGDGIDDLVIGYSTQSRNDGFLIVVFGTQEGFPAEFDATLLDGSNGFRVNGEPLSYEDGSQFGNTASFAGDFNADGYEDLVVGTFNSSGNSLPTSSYVFFGRPNGMPPVVEASDIDGTDGFRLDSYQRTPSVPGQPFFDKAGQITAGAGDFNGDGYADLLLGAPEAHTVPDGTNIAFQAGATYVVFGSDVGAYQPGVTATFSDGVLTVEGTDKRDQLQISQTGIRSFEIRGLESTTINGASVLSFSNVTDVSVDTGRGADEVILATSVFGTSLSLNTGRGRDYVEVRGGAERGDLTINTGRGDDHMVFPTGLGSGWLRVSVVMGKGNDRMQFLPEARAGIPAFVDLGEGDDVLQGNTTAQPRQSFDRIDGGIGIDRIFESSFFGGSAAITGFEGFVNCPNDTGCFVGGEATTEVVDGVLTIKGKNNFDHDLRLTSTGEGQVSVESLGFGASIVGATDFTGIDRVKVVLGSGRDNVFAEDLWLTDNLIINTGLGDDSVTVSGGTLERLRINTGGGDDEVLLDGVTVNRRAKVMTGWGVDHLSIRDSLFKRKAIFEGGLDDDTLELLAGNDFEKGYDSDFEL